MDTKQDCAAPWFWFPTNREIHTRIDGLTFQGIIVKSPLIAARSIFGSPYAGSLKNIRARELEINGVRVSEENKGEYFEIDDVHTREINFATEAARN